MHTILVIAAGLLLLGICLALGRLIGGPGPAPLATAARSFVPVWLFGSLINMWVGVSQAGYSLAEELPVLGVVFAVPAVVAVVLWRRWLSESRRVGGN
jgi:hypothetical protein